MIGKLISHYKILEELGRVGMGVVYKAEDTKLKREVALKFLPLSMLASKEEKARFEHEAQAVAALNHPNICTIYEIDEHDGQAFIAIEFIAGQSLKEKIEASSLQLNEALEVAIQVAEGLQEAHEKGTYERGGGKRLSGMNARRDMIIQWGKDVQRSIDYLEDRKDVDSERIAFCGLSMGAEYGPIFPALENRFRVCVFLGGGFDPNHMLSEPPEINPWNFAPRVKTPVLMINGRHDFIFPLQTSQVPMLRLLGVSEKDKRHVILEGGHIPPWNDVIRETLDWLDRYLGPVDYFVERISK